MSIFSKTDNLSKIAIYKLYLEVEVLGLDIRNQFIALDNSFGQGGGGGGGWGKALQ